MITLKLEIELKYDPEYMHGGGPEERQWFIEDLLGVGKDLPEESSLILHSNEIGEEVGMVKVLKVLGGNEI